MLGLNKSLHTVLVTDRLKPGNESIRKDGYCLCVSPSLRSSSSKLAQLTLEQILEHMDNLRLNLSNTKNSCESHTHCFTILKHTHLSCNSSKLTPHYTPTSVSPKHASNPVNSDPTLSVGPQSSHRRPSCRHCSMSRPAATRPTR